MFDFVWSLKLKLRSMLQEIEWYIELKRNDIKGYQELLTLFPKMLMVYTMAIGMDMVKLVTFLRRTLSKKLIFIPATIMLLLFSYYLFLVAGKPNWRLFEEQIFPRFYYDTAIEIRDQNQRLAGSMAQPQSLVKNPSLYIQEPPKLFWSLLKEHYDPYLNFESNATSFVQALLENPRYYNGIDVLNPLVESKNLLVRAIMEQRFEIHQNPTLTQQLIHDFLKKHPLKGIKTQRDRLELAKSIFHPLKAHHGANFKSWLLLEHPFFFTQGISYGLRDTAEIFFGKSLRDLDTIQQTLLIGLYAHPYHLNQSPKEAKEAWERIKKEAIKIVNASKLIPNQYYISSQIQKMPQPKLPYFPDDLMEVVGKITPQNQESFSALPSRSLALLQSTKAVITQELDKLFQSYSISPQSRLVTQATINFRLDENFYFNHYLKNRVEELPIHPQQLWISVVNESGEFIRLYQHNTQTSTPPQIGNIAKLFSALLFADRGDQYYTKYCNKTAPDEIPTETGTTHCQEGSWIDARHLFASEQLLPLYDGFHKYRQRDRHGDQVYYTPIYMQQIEQLYNNLGLIPLQNNEPKSDLGAGKLQMSPLDLQVALQKITQLLYRPNQPFNDAKLIRSIQYHTIDRGVLSPETKNFSLDAPASISPRFEAFFSPKKRITIKTLYKAPIYQKFGHLQWLRNYINIKFLFAQESHKGATHWLVGAFKRQGKRYSFVLHIQESKASNETIKSIMKQLLESTIKSINRPNKMKFEYMKQIFND